MKGLISLTIDTEVLAELGREKNKSALVEDLLRAYLQKPVENGEDINKKIEQQKAVLAALEKTKAEESKLLNINDAELSFIEGIPTRLERGADKGAIFNLYKNTFKKFSMRQGYFWKIVDKTLNENKA